MGLDEGGFTVLVVAFSYSTGLNEYWALDFGEALLLPGYGAGKRT